MKKKFIITIAIIVGLIAFIGVLRTINSPERVTMRYFNAHIEELKVESTEYENNGTISADIDVKRSVWRGEHTIIEYTVLAKGFASASQYYGVFYSVDDVPVSFQNSNVSLVPIADDVWEWKEAGDNRGLVKKIEDNWYYFEASF